ncbi:MAG: hypothetical protein HC910_05990 [Spirulinaceae cyanobacterium SM2_1_0]|nr:hypothetical protein [Spirulinaceae cyanobacterium SM2_1_0]
MPAILALPVVVVTAIWAAYTDRFVAQLREIYNRRAQADAQSLADNQYRHCQAHACRDCQ